MLSCLFLVYSAYVVPMQLSFWMRDNPCDPFQTLYTDLLVDTFFLVSDSQLAAPSLHESDPRFRRPQFEIAANFFIGYYDNGCYVHSLSEVAKHYTSSPSRFWFDVGTSVPLSYADLYYTKVASPQLLTAPARFEAELRTDAPRPTRSGELCRRRRPPAH